MNTSRATSPPKPRSSGKRGGRPTNRPDAETLEALYRSHTAAEIGHMYGVAKGTVHRWIWQYRHPGARRGRRNR